METWKDIPGYEGYYQCSNIGSVMSLSITVNMKDYTRIRTGKLLKQHISNCGYMRVLLSKLNKRVFVSVHRLIAISFITNSENKLQVNHKNGIKTDNRVENLEWVSPSENQKHAYLLGLKCAKGELNGRRMYKLKMKT